MRYVLKFITIILPRRTKFCQYFILLIENLNLYSDEDGMKHIRIKARPNKWHENDCPFCHKSCPAYDKHSSRPTTWRGLDWGGILVEVEYQTHRIICLEHGVLACADSVLIPVQAAYLPVKGLQQLIKTIGRVKKQLNPKLKIEGILLTMVDNRTNYARDISLMVYDTYSASIKVFGTEIPMSVRASEVSVEGGSIYSYDPKGKAAFAYMALTKEVLKEAE